MILRIVGGVAIVAAAAAAAILLNLTLLGSAESRNDPLGKLSPRAALVPVPAPAPASPPVVVRPSVGRHEHDD